MKFSLGEKRKNLYCKWRKKETVGREREIEIEKENENENEREKMSE